MNSFPLFAAGAGYCAFNEFEELESGRERDWALTLSRLCQVMQLGVDEAATDLWSPPELYMCRFGAISTIYAIKRGGNVGADVLVLVSCDLRGERSASRFEALARRRLASADYWRT